MFPLTFRLVGTDPELRLHRIDSKPQFTSGDVIAEVSASNGHESSTTEKVDPHATGNAAAGGGRVDV